MVEKDSEEAGRDIHRSHCLRREMPRLEIWRCPKCKATAEIKGNVKTIKSKVAPGSQGFPTHRDCQLARPIAKMDFSKLVKIGGE